MKAAIINRFGSPEVLKIEEVPVPEIKDNEVLIKVKASSVNPVDWKHRLGNHKLVLGSNFPIILGYDVSGTVEKTAIKVTKFKAGDKVYARVNIKYGGTYAEYAVTSVETLAKIPDKINFEEAAAIPLAAITALQGLRDKGNIKPGDNILINGAAGGVGHFALQIAKYFDSNVTAVCSSRHKEMMQDLNPDVHIDYEQTNIKSLQVKYDIIFDVVGTESFKTLNHLLKPNGIYITTLPRPKVLFHKILALFSDGKKVKTFLMKSNGSDLEFLNKMIEEDKLKIFIDKIYSLEEIQEAHRYSESGKAAGKIIIKVS